MFKVGDMACHSWYGVGILETLQREQRELSKKINGPQLFDFHPLLGEKIRPVFEKEMYRFRMATDADIITELTQETCRFDLNTNMTVYVQPDTKSLFLYNNDCSESVTLNAKELKVLKKILGELCV